MDVSGSHQLDLSHNIKKKSLDRFGAVVGREVTHELGHTLKEEHVKEYAAAVNKNTTDGLPAAAAAVPTPAPAPPRAPKVDPTKVPGYCGPCYGAELRPGQCCNTVSLAMGGSGAQPDARWTRGS